MASGPKLMAPTGATPNATNGRPNAVGCGSNARDIKMSSSTNAAMKNGRTSNHMLVTTMKTYPKLFVAHGLIDPQDPKIVDKLRYWVKEHGFQGMRFSPIYHPRSTWLNSLEHYPLWREAEKLEVVFNFYIAPQQMPMLEDMAGRFPGVKIIVDHAGKPDPWAFPFMLPKPTTRGA